MGHVFLELQSSGYRGKHTLFPDVHLCNVIMWYVGSNRTGRKDSNIKLSVL